MCRPSLLAAGLLTALLIVVPGCGGPPASPFEGTWKVTALPAGKEITMWLVRIESKEDGLHASVVAAGLSPFAGATVNEVRADGDALHLTLDVNDRTYAFVFRRPDGRGGAETAAGLEPRSAASATSPGWSAPTSKALSEKEALVVHDTADELKRVLQADPGPTREAALRNIAERRPAGRPNSSRACCWSRRSPAQAGGRGADQADKAVAFAGPYGPEMRRQALRAAALQVRASGKLPALALDYARQADRTLEAPTPAEERLPVLKVLAAALRAAGQEGDVAEVEERMELAEEELDRAWEEKSLPFEPEPFPAAGKSGRVVLVELFTGAGCPPCVAADLAFDGLLRTYPPTDVVWSSITCSPHPRPADQPRHGEARPILPRPRHAGPPRGRPPGPRAGRRPRHGPSNLQAAPRQRRGATGRRRGRHAERPAAQQGRSVEITAEAGGLARRGCGCGCCWSRTWCAFSAATASGYTITSSALPRRRRWHRLKRRKARQHVTIDLAELRK